MNTDKPYNVWNRHCITLKLNEFLCHECNGRGAELTILGHPKDYLEHVKIVMCTKCRGEGKLDWISRVINNYNQSSITYTIEKKSREITQIRCNGPMIISTYRLRDKLYESYNNHKRRMKNEKAN